MRERQREHRTRPVVGHSISRSIVIVRAAHGPYRLNGISTFYWEIVGPDGKVHRFIPKLSDDANRQNAMRILSRLNRVAVSR
jgi:hypothetical protein